MNTTLWIASFVSLFLSGGWVFANQKNEKKCIPPSQGPAWLQDFSPKQKSRISLEWKNGVDSATYTLEGTYQEETEKNLNQYSEYQNDTELEAVEKWKCTQDQKSQFESISGTMENEVEWKIKSDEETQNYEAENDFLIKSIEEVRQTRHESEKTIKGKNPWRKKEYSEELEWKQTWDPSGMPTITGKLKIESREETSSPRSQEPETKQLASAILIPGFLPSQLAPGRVLSIETTQEGTLNGPIDPISLETIQIVKQRDGEKILEEKEIRTKENRYYVYNPASKAYEFLSMNELIAEVAENSEENKKTTVNKLDSWSDLNQPPDKTSYWKRETLNLKVGKSSTFTVNSQGHDLLPPLFNINEKNGSYTRITDFNPRGRITRFLVLYFPARKKGNETKMDLKFDENGKPSEFLINDGLKDLSFFEDPLSDPAALYTIQSKINSVIEMEKLSQQKHLPRPSLNPADYPVIYRKETPGKS